MVLKHIPKYICFISQAFRKFPGFLFPKINKMLFLGNKYSMLIL